MRFSTRVAVVFGTVSVMFLVLIGQMWRVQIAQGAVAAEETRRDNWVVLETPAPRGDIYDRNGKLLATSRYLPMIWVDRSLVRSDQKEQVIQGLAGLLGIPVDELTEKYEAAGVNGRFPVKPIDVFKAYQVAEELRNFPGVRIIKTPERVYLTGTAMAHVIGHLGLPTAEDLLRNPGMNPETRIGKLGVEGNYEEYLAGTPGRIEFKVEGSQVVAERPEIAPIPGDNIYLTLDMDLQVVVEYALKEGVASANRIKKDLKRKGEDVRNPVERAVAIVLDAKMGEVLAMSSYPAFDPSAFVGGLSLSSYDEMREKGAFLNLAISGLYPPASTFKVVAYMASMEEDLPLPIGTEGVDPFSRLVHCDGEFISAELTDGSPQIQHDWYWPSGYLGWLDLHGALKNSCNIYFWSLAVGIWQNRDRYENILQETARDLSYGEITGIDLPGEREGIVPDRDLFIEYRERQLDNPDAPRLLEEWRLYVNSPWVGGDLMNLAIGQGSLVATPLQVAVSYAALVNGGKVLRPYVVKEAVGADGKITYDGTPWIIRDLELDPDNVEDLRNDLASVVKSGTARKAFLGFGSSISDVGGKTGTGQVRPKDNHAWFAGVVGIEDPEYIVIVLLDEGHSGGAIAAPVARYIMQYLKGEELDPIEAGEFAN